MIDTQNTQKPPDNPNFNELRDHMTNKDNDNENTAESVIPKN